MSIKSSWVKSPWTISIVSALLVPSLSLIRDLIKSLPILSTFKSILWTVWKYIVLFLNLEVKIWWILAVIVLIALVLFLIDKFLLGAHLPQPDFCSYKSGRPKNWKWTWDWQLNCTSKKWEIINLTAHCLKCDTSLIERSSYRGTSFLCPRCNIELREDFAKIEHPFVIESLILDNIKRGIRE